MEHLRSRMRMEAEMLLLIHPMQRAQNLTAKMQSPIKRTAKMGIQQITEKPRRNRTVTMQMEMVESLAEIRERHLPCWI